MPIKTLVYKRFFKERLKIASDKLRRISSGKLLQAQLSLEDT